MERLIQEETHEFFNRSAAEVAREFSEQWYLGGQDSKLAVPGIPGIMRVEDEDLVRIFKIKLAQAFSAQDPGKIWKGRVLDELKAMQPGEMIVYARRSGLIPFVVTQGGDNIALRELEDISSGERLTSALQISRALKLEAKDRGKLTYLGDHNFNFQRISA